MIIGFFMALFQISEARQPHGRRAPDYIGIWLSDADGIQQVFLIDEGRNILPGFVAFLQFRFKRIYMKVLVQVSYMGSLSAVF